jgi:GNAT superfamily N-acetyltransferase
MDVGIRKLNENDVTILTGFHLSIKGEFSRMQHKEDFQMRTDVRNWLSGNKHHFWGAFSGGRLVGIIRFDLNHKGKKNTAYWGLSYLRKRYRHQGIGKELAERGWDFLKSKGVTHVVGDTGPRNREMQSFFKSKGGKRTAVSFLLQQAKNAIGSNKGSIKFKLRVK